MIDYYVSIKPVSPTVKQKNAVFVEMNAPAVNAKSLLSQL